MPDELQRAVAAGFLNGAERREAVGRRLVERWRDQDAIGGRVPGRQLLDRLDSRGLGRDVRQRLAGIDAPGEDQKIRRGQAGQRGWPAPPSAQSRALPDPQHADDQRQPKQRSSNTRIADVGRPEQAAIDVGVAERVAVVRQRQIPRQDRVSGGDWPCRQRRVEADQRDGHRPNKQRCADERTPNRDAAA